MSTSVATQDHEPKGIRALLRATTDRWAPFVPKGVDPEAVVQAAYLETKKVPALLKCTPESILQAVTRIQQLNLRIGVTAYLVPFKDTKSGQTTCTMVVGKDGVVELITASGVVRHVDARCFYENEPFKFVAGTETRIDHLPIADETERGALRGAYAVFRMRGGDVQAHVMTYAQIEAIRQKYSKQWKSGAMPEWYMEKTVIIHGAGHLPKNPKLAASLAALDGEFSVMGATAAVAAPKEPVRLAPPQPLAVMDGYEERARVITAGPVRESAIDEANRVLAEHGEDGYGGEEGGFVPPY
jgi:recombination protein RecT